MLAGHNSGAGFGPLPGLVERIEALEEQRKEIAAQIAAVKAEAKAAGFDRKVLNAILKERQLTAFERQEYATLLELYRAALGMLDGTPLGEAARRRLAGEKPMPPKPSDASTPAAPETVDRTLDIEAARQAGRDAAKAGAKVIENPYVAGDPRRAAWDEGWCAETGSDGMEIPEAWRRTTPRKKRKGKADGEDDGGKPDGDGDGAPEGGAP